MGNFCEKTLLVREMTRSTPPVVGFSGDVFLLSNKALVSCDNRSNNDNARCMR